jgi:hypothetical protein
MDNKVLADLVNAPFTFKLADREFQIKKANIRQVQQYVTRLSDLSKDKEMNPAARDLEVLSYCLFLSLSKVDPSITEDFVKENLPGAVDGLELLSTLGFIDPEKVQMIKKLQEKLISENSSSQ